MQTKIMPSYEFVTIWHVHAPLERVWNEIYYSEKWPEWWKGVEHVVELKKGDDLGVGSRRSYAWKSKLPYRLTFEIETVRVESMSIIEGIATGELQGKGIWNVSNKRGVTTARYV